jgi:hypothetical protein
LTAHNNLTDTQQTNLQLTGGTSDRKPITVAPVQVAKIDTHGVAAASSSPACSGSACTDHTTATGAGGNSTSGAAAAQGVVAVNKVKTNATAAVHVGGQNFAPITILIDSVTKIFNAGVASSTSGNATTGGGTTAAGSGGSAARSGSARAVGAQVVNRADIHSSASVHVSGDNYSPINLILNLAAQFMNWGVGTASSGDARSAASASSGKASATGLRVRNLVNMSADASVDVQGNNYAPIVIEVHFYTTLDNRGVAVANSGAASTASAGHSSGSSHQPGHASGGKAVATGNTADASFESTQMSSANGGRLPMSAAMARAVQDLPTGNWSNLVEQRLSNAVTPTPPGVTSTSGDAVAQGMHSAIDQSNTQLAACTDPGVNCLARNDARLASTVSDLPFNPASGQPGGTHASAGRALVNPTPTPAAPSSKTGAAAKPPEHYYVAAELAPTGSMVVVDPWDDGPSRWLPPMPEPAADQPYTSSVQAAFGAMAAVEELPLPEVHSRVPAAIQGPGASRDVPALSPDMELPVPLMSILNVEAVDNWPAVQRLPMPDQARPIITSASITVGDELGASSVDFGPGTLLALVFGSLGGSRQGRRMLLTFATRLLPFAASVGAVLLLVGRI